MPAEAPPTRRRALEHRYTRADLGVLTPAEAKRFAAEALDPATDLALAWELLYRREPSLYDRLVRAERLHPELVAWLPRGLDRIVEVGAGTGRLTLSLLDRAREIVAIEPAAPLRDILIAKLSRTPHGVRARVRAGFFDELPLPDAIADLVVACSAFTPDPAHGGDAGLAEMERVCRPAGTVAILWPNHLDWLAERGYRHVSFAGDMSMEFSSPAEAVELCRIFFPDVGATVRASSSRRVPYELLGINAPRDVAFKVMPA